MKCARRFPPHTLSSRICAASPPAAEDKSVREPSRPHLVRQRAKRAKPAPLAPTARAWACRPLRLVCPVSLERSRPNPAPRLQTLVTSAQLARTAQQVQAQRPRHVSRGARPHNRWRERSRRRRRRRRRGLSRAPHQTRRWAMVRSSCLDSACDCLAPLIASHRRSTCGGASWSNRPRARSNSAWCLRPGKFLSLSFSPTERPQTLGQTGLVLPEAGQGARLSPPDRATADSDLPAPAERAGSKPTDPCGPRCDPAPSHRLTRRSNRPSVRGSNRDPHTFGL